MRTLKSFNGRGSNRDCRDWIGRQLQFGGEPVSGRAWRDGLGRVLAALAAPDGYDAVELDASEAQDERAAFCAAQATEHESRAKAWPAGHPLAAMSLRDAAVWRDRETEARKGAARAA